MINNDKKKELEYQVYLEERKSLIDMQREGARFFDKAILTLTAGVFGLSITFIQNIAPTIRPESLFALKFAWGSFGTTLLATLVSFVTSQSACSRAIDILEEEYIKSNNGTQKNCYAGITRFLNILSLVAFTIGICFLAYFSFLNLQVTQ